jgi:hypothetical protein
MRAAVDWRGHTQWNRLLNCQQEVCVLHLQRLRFSRGLTRGLLAGWMILSGAVASACTIPVFRYALERWETDRLLVIVHFDGQLTPEQELTVGELEQRSSVTGGPLNIEVVRRDESAPASSTLPDAVTVGADRELPWVEIRARRESPSLPAWWQGPLSSIPPGIFDSPARSELVRRILNGHSAVWLIVAPENQTQMLAEQLQASLDRATRDLELPRGIGQPGSELYSAIPLEIRYSVLAVSHTDPQEQQLLELLRQSAKQWNAESAYVIPVFGRCRALEVIPHAEVDEPLVEEIASFLCAACSCRVKEANPGFDLLVSVNWNDQLFTDSIPPLVPAGELQKPGTDSGKVNDGSQIVAIPPGNGPEASAAQERPGPAAVRRFPLWLSALVPLVILAIVGAALACVTYQQAGSRSQKK